MCEISKSMQGSRALLAVVMTSRATRQRALRAHQTWCSSTHRLGCLFVADAPFGAGLPSGMQWRVQPAAPPPDCCKHGRGFFCSAHRRQTLPAQYRYLPALQAARRARPFAQFRWVVIVDDDSYVFVPHMLRLLSGYSHRRAVMLGEFKGDGSYACGGAGACTTALAIQLPEVSEEAEAHPFEEEPAHKRG